jgi:hypothetical protein
VTASDWLETFGLLLIMASPFTIGLIVQALDDRRKQRGQGRSGRPMSPTEFYVIQQARKREALRHLRAVAREHRRPPRGQRRNHPNNTWR